MSATTAGPARRHVDTAALPVALVVLGVAVVLTVGLVTMEVPSTANAPGPRVFPIGITVLAYVVGAVLLVQALLGRTSGPSHPQRPEPTHHQRPEPVEGPPETHDDETGLRRAQAAGVTEPAAAEVEASASREVSWPRVALLLGLLLVFALVLEPLGWLLSATGLFFGVTVALGARPRLRTLGIAIILAAGIQLVFAGLLGLALLTGFIGGL
ncbi:tripartite tricarboxylate transporter TctB family protein [Desertihabitans aurantiacus]|uniref:tripartite tricarboxylate transporter TctB family protein n=1 Tax=Desertihabitans aurantiacus TaxID=2282477 RepID=UPI0013003025|nr:tripartite tricarboxylate transporter TctB family protein [Desertihabitans aurantiacus]